MDLRHLQQFIALAEEGQFTAAARKMNIVQSGLSVTIKELEQELGATLVNRTTRRLSLTKAGQLFLEHARSSLAILRDGVEAVRSQDSVVRGRLHLGILQSLAPYIDLPHLLHRFRDKYPEVEFAVRSLSTQTIPAHVRAGYVDLSFHVPVGGKKWAGLREIPYKQDVLVAVSSRQRPLAKRLSVSLEALAREEFVDLTPDRALRTFVDRSFAENGLRRNSIYQVSDIDTMLQLVEGDLGVAIVPSELARSRQLHVLKVTAVRSLLPQWRIVILTREQRRHVPGKTTVDHFLEMLGSSNGAA